MRSDSVKNMSAYADQNHAPSLTDVRLEKMLWLSRRSSWYDKSVMIQKIEWNEVSNGTVLLQPYE